ncbi:hypothetical protein Slin15195_G088010 [Septoria linicola]|uniref:Uncharacterized protein n=1 Tax=Septoria linicola TaxID=215465 RepID=A0A9Q9B106_9PEZI|nr:hypothetical protein Slin15195_G088010 [Septoria linicola]
MEYEVPLQLLPYKPIYTRPPVLYRPDSRLTLRSTRHRKQQKAYPIFNSAAADSAATKVFNITELVEQILQHYEATDYKGYEDVATMSVMLKLQLINKTMRGVVMHSPYFSRLLFLKETPGARRPWFVQVWNSTLNPILTHAPSMLRDCFYPFVQVSWGMSAQQFRLQLKYQYSLQRGLTSPAQQFRGIREKVAKHSEGTWRLMKLHYKQDMTVAITIKVSCRHCGYDSEEEVVLEKGSHQILLAKDASLGDVVDCARDLVTWIEAVALEGHDLENYAGDEW